MDTLRLYKKEKLCSSVAIDALFLPSSRLGGECMSAMAYPWRAVWRVNTGRRSGIGCPQFLISVPKKRLRRAVDRVAMRRRMREAYRLNRNLIAPDRPIDIAFIYVGSGLTSYSDAVRSVHKILAKISAN